MMSPNVVWKKGCLIPGVTQRTQPGRKGKGIMRGSLSSGTRGMAWLGSEFPITGHIPADRDTAEELSPGWGRTQSLSKVPHRLGTPESGCHSLFMSSRSAEPSIWASASSVGTCCSGPPGLPRALPGHSRSRRS